MFLPGTGFPSCNIAVCIFIDYSPEASENIAMCIATMSCVTNNWEYCLKIELQSTNVPVLCGLIPVPICRNGILI